MKHIKRSPHQRLKLVLVIVASLTASAALISLSVWMRPDQPARVGRRAAATAPATAPAAPTPEEQKAAAAQNISGMLLLFGLAGALVAVVFGILLAVDIRNARPAWQSQQRYPKRR